MTAENPSARSDEQRPRPLLVCLLPARNAAGLLADTLDSIAQFADAVVALDDGSTDETGSILRTHPLVTTVLVNRIRDDDAGGHDGANRNRLLAAAAELSPQWVISLEQDERVDASDAAALRRFVESDALPGCAYGFKRYRMQPNGTYDPVSASVYRLFAFRPGQHFAGDALDVVPVPSEIPSRLWLKTTLRIQQSGGPAPGPFLSWRPRPRDAPVLDLPAGHTGVARPAQTDGGSAGGGASRVVCLLPARNAALDLPQWFESVAKFADAVVALDDGSTDATAEILFDHPLVEVLLRNAPRQDDAGGNDSVNRNRLLEAVGSLAPHWIIAIDADERVPPEDGEALRRFVDEQAVAGFAYGFPRYRAVGDTDHYDLRQDCVYRLFAYRPNVEFPEGSRSMSVPTSIPRCRWLATNIRIQHLVPVAPERSRALTIWPRRRAAQPVILEALFDDWIPLAPDFDLDLDWPALSVVVIVSETQLDEMVELLDALVDHDVRHPFEVIVLARGDEVADDIARMRPGTTVVVVTDGSSPGATRNLGLRVARGDYAVFFDAPATLAPGALTALVDAHDEGCGVVSAEAVNWVPSATGWASFFDDAAHCSFAREPLLRLGGFDERLTEGIESHARDRLIGDGQRVAHTDLVTFGHHSSLTTSREYLSEHFALGRATARDTRGTRDRRRLLPTMVRRDTRRLAGVRRRAQAAPPDAASAFERVRLLVLGGILAGWAGAAREQLRAVSAAVVRRASRAQR